MNTVGTIITGSLILIIWYLLNRNADELNTTIKLLSQATNKGVSALQGR